MLVFFIIMWSIAFSNLNSTFRHTNIFQTLRANNTGARPIVHSENIFTYGSGLEFIHSLVCRTKAVQANHSHVSCMGRAFGNYRLVVQPRISLEMFRNKGWGISHFWGTTQPLCSGSIQQLRVVQLVFENTQICSTKFCVQWLADGQRLIREVTVK